MRITVQEPVILSGSEREAYVQWWADAMLHGALVDLFQIKVRFARSERREIRRELRCVHPVTGEPVVIKHRVEPVSGSVQDVVSGALNGGEVKHPVQRGRCPFCPAVVQLSARGGFITSHNRGRETAPRARTHLVERRIGPVEGGARVGDVDGGMRQRAADVAGQFERGTVKIQVIDPESGKKVMRDAPATQENMRTALEYWKGRKPRSETGLATKARMISELSRMLRAFDGAPSPLYDRETRSYKPTVGLNVPVFTTDPATGDVVDTGKRERGSMVARHSPEGLASPHAAGTLAPSPVSGGALRVSQMMAGPASYRGKAEPTMAGPITRSVKGDPAVTPEPCEDTRKGWAASAGTMGDPLGRERFDREVTGDRPRARFSDAQRAHYRKKMRRLAAKGMLPARGKCDECKSGAKSGKDAQ